MSKRVPKCGVFAFKRVRRERPRNKKRWGKPVWIGVAIHPSKDGTKERYHRAAKCRTEVVCRVVIPLNDEPPKKCIKEVEDARV